MSKNSNRLLQRRKELRLTQAEVGKAAGVAASTVMKWEKGAIKSIGSDKLAALAKVLDVSPLWLMGRTDDPVTALPKAPETLGPEESELVRIYEHLDLRGRNKLLAYAWALEENREDAVR